MATMMDSFINPPTADDWDAMEKIRASRKRLEEIERKAREARKQEAEAIRAKVRAREAALQESQRADLDAQRVAAYAGDRGTLDADTEEALATRARRTNPLASNMTWPGFWSDPVGGLAAADARRRALKEKLAKRRGPGVLTVSYNLNEQEKEAIRARKEARKQEYQAKMSRVRNRASQRRWGQTLDEFDAQQAGARFLGGAAEAMGMNRANPYQSAAVLGANDPNLTRIRTAGAAMAGMGQGGGITAVPPDLVNQVTGGPLATSPVGAIDAAGLAGIKSALASARQAQNEKPTPKTVTQQANVLSSRLKDTVVKNNPALTPDVQQLVLDALDTGNYETAAALLRGKVPDQLISALFQDISRSPTADINHPEGMSMPWQGTMETMMNPNVPEWKKAWLAPGAGWQLMTTPEGRRTFLNNLMGFSF